MGESTPGEFFLHSDFFTFFIFTLFHFFYIFLHFQIFSLFLHFCNFQIFSLFYIFTFLQFFQGHSSSCFFFRVGSPSGFFFLFFKRVSFFFSRGGTGKFFFFFKRGCARGVIYHITGSSTKEVKLGTAYNGNHSNIKRNLNLKLAKKEVTPLSSDFANTGQDDFASLPVKRQKVTAPSNEVIDDFEDDVDFSEINEFEVTGTVTPEQNRNVKSSNLTVSCSRSVFSSVPGSNTNTSNHKQSNLTLSKPKRETLKAVKSEPAVSSVKSHIGMTQSIRDEKPKANVGIDRFFSLGKAASTESEAFGTESGMIINIHCFLLS